MFGGVTCAYPRKLFINILQIVADYLLLAVTMMVLEFSLCWYLLYYPSKEGRIAQFYYYNSCIDPKYYYKPSKMLHIFNENTFILSEAVLMNPKDSPYV